MEGLLAQMGPEKANKILTFVATDPDTVGEVLSAVTADPVTMRCVAGDIAPAFEPVTDYITDVEERCRLFNEFRQMMPQAEFENIAATTFACFMVAPIPEIRNFLTSAKTTSIPDIMQVACNAAAPLAMRACTSSLSFSPTRANISR